MEKDGYVIRAMTREEIDTAVDWAAAEGWNPGLHDADCFHAADPGGFFVGMLDDEPIATKIRKIATTVYGAEGIELAAAARESIARIEKQGLAHLPICMAKTHLSLSHDPALRNRPEGFVVPIRDIRVYSGAGMLVPLCGDMLQMPGFGPTPAAFAIDIDENGETVGLF